MDLTPMLASTHILGAPGMTQDYDDPTELLGPMASRFEGLGLTDIAERLRTLLNQDDDDIDDADVLSLEEATAMLELRSPSTVLALVECGILEGSVRDGTTRVVRASVAQLRGTRVLTSQRQMEDQLWSLLEPE